MNEVLAQSYLSSISKIQKSIETEELLLTKYLQSQYQAEENLFGAIGTDNGKHAKNAWKKAKTDQRTEIKLRRERARFVFGSSSSKSEY